MFRPGVKRSFLRAPAGACGRDGAAGDGFISIAGIIAALNACSGMKKGQVPTGFNALIGEASIGRWLSRWRVSAEIVPANLRLFTGPSARQTLKRFYGPKFKVWIQA